MNSLVDDYLKKVKNWKDELTVLRTIVLESGLVEELKWRNPCYTFEGKNIVIIGGFKEFCVLSFFKGILLSDPEKILKQQGENTQSARIIPFTSVSEILLQKHTILAYIYEAVEIEIKWPKEVGQALSDAAQGDEHLLTLMACYPLLSDAQRMLVKARLRKPKQLSL